MYRALLFDLDGTLTPVRSVWQHIHETLGLWEADARRHQEAFVSGGIDYEEFCRRDAAHWHGMREAELRAIADRIPYRPGVREAIDEARARGAVIGVVSTGLTLLADRVHRELGLAFTMANRLVSRHGVLTGEVRVNVRHARKDEAVDLFCGQFGIDRREVVSVGDSDGDISMFARTGWSVACRPASADTAAAASQVHDGDSILDLVRTLPLGAGAPAAPAGGGRRTVGVTPGLRAADGRPGTPGAEDGDER
jgi:phosphoserine phosphatase